MNVCFPCVFRPVLMFMLDTFRFLWTGFVLRTLAVLLPVGLGLCSTTSVWAWSPLLVNGRCIQSGNVCWTHIGNAGNSNACCDPLAGNLATCIQQNPCRGTAFYRWESRDVPVLWFFNDNKMAGQEGYAGLQLADLEKSLKTAWDAWTKPTCTTFRHIYGGKTERKPYWSDQVVVLYLVTSTEWAQLGINAGVLAFTLPISDGNGNMRDADIYFNPKPIGRGWGLDPVPAQSIDFTDVATHEIGHAIGFGHSEDNNAVMYYSVRGLGPLFQGITTDDKNGICILYPVQQGCQQSDVCGACRVCSQQTCVDEVSRDPKSCLPCATDADCGTGGRCVQTSSGRRCLQPCGTKGCCPTGFHCKSIASISACVPVLGHCPPVSCTSDANCGAGESCQGTPKTCQLQQPPRHFKSCQTACKTDQDCGPQKRCIALAPEARRCVEPCEEDAFCPVGFVCQSLAGKSWCIPQAPPFCPCQNHTDCLTGQQCMQGLCQKPQGGIVTDPCHDQAQCRKGLLCAYTDDRQLCTVSCDPNSSTVIPGTIGGPCLLDRSCYDQLSCQRLPQGFWTCVQPCQTPQDCTQGGTCSRLGSGTQTYCLCQQDKDCKAGTFCNHAPKTTQTQDTGICAEKLLTAQCPTGYECKTFQNVYQVCLPEPSRKQGEPCDGINACVANHACVENPHQPGSFVCVRTCGAGLQCQQGACFTVSSHNVCLCEQDAQCPSGHKCNTQLFQGRGLCECNSPQCKDCGNGICDTNQGETCETCPTDCACSNNRVCFQHKCTGTCGDGTCDPNENCSSCLDCACPKGQECVRGECHAFCGNGTCDQGETCSNCVADCACPSGKQCTNGTCSGFCGDGTCDPSEHCTSCAQDCGCPNNKVCIKGICEDRSQQNQCGNGQCQISLGEGCANCPQDCACQNTEQCIQNVCRSNPFSEIPVIPDLPPVQDLCQLSGSCPKKACGCETSSEAPIIPMVWFLMLLFIVRLFRN